MFPVHISSNLHYFRCASATNLYIFTQILSLLEKGLKYCMMLFRCSISDMAKVRPSNLFLRPALWPFYGKRKSNSVFQHLIVGDLWNKIIHKYATHLLHSLFWNTGFGDPKVSACDPKMGRDPPVEKHSSRVH